MRFVASAGALLQLAVTGVALLGWIGLERAGAALRQGLCQAGPGWRSDRPLRLLGLAILILAALVTFAGLALLALWSLAGPWPFPHTWPQQLTLSEWRRAGPRSLSLLANTVSLALLTAALATVLAVLCLAREDETGSTGGRRAEWLLYLPLIVPQTRSYRAAADVPARRVGDEPGRTGADPLGLRDALCVPVARRPMARLRSAP